MPDDPRVRRLLEEVLDSGSTPEEVCRDFPELLPRVRERWRRVRAVGDQVGALFPTPGADYTPHVAWATAELPRVPGYDVQAVLGRGGMGVVFQAWHLRLNRPVALKMLLAGACATPAEQERFLREAEAVAGLRHPSIVQVHDVGDHDGRLYFTMEFVEGGSLARKLAGTPQPAREAAALLATLAEAVQVAHRGGIVHRDLKPANVLLTADGTPKISDFGLARHLGDGAGLTQSGDAVGTPSYMAPEQAQGRARAAGPAADVYALGAILYEVLTGRPPFRAATALETVRQVIAQEPVPPSRLNASVPRDLETVCLKCLEKNPQRRYATAAALADDLRRFQRGEPITARPVGRAERVARWARRYPAAAALVVTASLLLALGVVAGVREWELTVRQRAASARWADRLAHVTALQLDGRFAEARAILREGHTDDPDRGRQIAEASARLDLVERLDGIRLGRGRNPQGSGLDYAESSRRYAEAFRSAGLGEVGEDAELVARRLDPSPVRKAVIAALDDWAACAEKRERDWVLSVALRLDPDPWRDRVREPDAWAKTDAFPALVAAADIPRQPVTLMVAFGTRWRRLGGDPTAFLERVQRRYPTDFWVNFELGHLLSERDPPAAIGYYRAALAVRPDAAVAHGNLGTIFARSGRTDDAIHHYRRCVDSDPSQLVVLISLGSTLANRGELDEGIGYWRRALALDPNQPAVRRVVRRALSRLGRLEEVRDEWRQLLAGSTGAHEDWDGYAELCLFLGREEDYRRACRDLLDRFGSSPDPQIAERTSRACLLAPSPPDEARRTASLIDRAMADGMERLPAWVPPYFWFAKGLAEYRLGNLENAVAVMTGKASGVLGPAPRLVTAMALYRLGRKEEARRTLDAAVKSFDWEPAEADTREAWMYHVLRRESERVLIEK